VAEWPAFVEKEKVFPFSACIYPLMSCCVRRIAGIPRQLPQAILYVSQEGFNVVVSQIVALLWDLIQSAEAAHHTEPLYDSGSQ